MARLTKAEREAVVDVLNERLAGGTDDLADALGIEDEDEAAKMMERLRSARNKLRATARAKST
jgi:hypothetical protein